MRLYIKEKVFSWSDKFTVKDAAGADRYYVEGELFSFGKKLHIHDAASNKEVAFVKQEIWSWLPRFYVYSDGQQVAQIKKEFSLFLPRYTVEGLNWEINGSFLAHEYEITMNGYPVVRISKEWMTWGDSYMLDIVNPQDEIIALAVVLAIDCVMEANSGSSHANN